MLSRHPLLHGVHFGTHISHHSIATHTKEHSRQAVASGDAVDLRAGALPSEHELFRRDIRRLAVVRLSFDRHCGIAFPHGNRLPRCSGPSTGIDADIRRNSVGERILKTAKSSRSLQRPGRKRRCQPETSVTSLAMARPPEGARSRGVVSRFARVGPTVHGDGE